MGRHQVQGATAHRARLSLGATALAGLIGSATSALVVPAAAPVVVPLARPAAAVTAAGPAVAPVAITGTSSSTRPVTGKQPTTTTRATATATGASTACDLSGPPVFGDPAHPDEITNRDCGYVDGQGRQRSHDAWIDDQLR
ncbi:hypothetical protein [Actinomycetospora chiangmaiensis]|uniref:hypothetical protein n=1 Tax=Actinomycetospora chiangmaiensis TaxID=402650 RepID=UPI00039C59B7|nr:hypothetical protein [Actinomycetospora chiangmaiensis]